MNSLRLAILLLILSGLHLGASDAGKPQIPWRHLSTKTQGGFVEYDFRPGGVLFRFTFDLDASITQPERNAQSDHHEPVFSVDHGRWAWDGKSLTMRFGNRDQKQRIYITGSKIQIGEWSYDKVERISALEKMEGFLK